MKLAIIYIFIIVFLAVAVPLFAQKKNQLATDTVYHYEDKALYRQMVFYRKWKTKTAKHKWSRELFNVLFDPPSAITPSKFISKKSQSSFFKNYEGYKIEKINFKITKPFGQYVDGLPTDSTNNKLERFGNKLQTRTRSKHLKRLLSFKEGDVLDIKQLEDNEEMLSDLPYVDELYIFIKESSPNAITVDFLVKEKFSWGMSFQVYKYNAYKTKLYNKNLWGRGHYALVEYHYDPTKRVVNSLGFKYKVASIGKSLVSLTTVAEHDNIHDRYGIELNRPFVDYKTRFAGGIRFDFFENSDRIPTNSIAHFENSVNYNEVDIWGGFSFPERKINTNKYARYRTAITARYYGANFIKHPEMRIDSNAFLYDTSGVLLAYNLSKKQLYRSNLLYNYGKVENIPYGYLAQLMVGTAFNKQERKGYLGTNLEKGIYYPKHDCYLGFKVSGGAFLDEKKFYEGLIRLEANYISTVYKFRNIKHRHFIKLCYMQGIHSADDLFDINESRGLKNLESELARGDQKIVMNIEDVFFTPYTIAGFRSAFYSFADLAYITSKNTSLSYENRGFYAGVGLGLRLHNNNFIFKTFQISFSVFLKAPKDSPFFRPDASSVKGRRFRNFQIEKPRFFFENEFIK